MKTKRKLTLALFMSFLVLASGASQAAVSKSQRRLLIVSNLKTFGMAKYEWLYKFLDASTISMGKAMIGHQYGAVYTLSPASAKLNTFKSTLQNITNIPSVKAVDVILSLHGADNKLWFKEGSYTTTQVKNKLLTVPKRSKFRLMYNLACYGASHRNEFTASGFRTAIGAIKVNAASASEYPEFLTRFGGGHNVKNIFASTNANPAIFVADNTAKMMGFSDANSKKYIRGYKYLKISSNAQ